MKMSPLFLLILGVSGVYSDSHTLRYYYTGLSGAGPGVPEFTAVGYVDDQQITSYNSDSHRTHPVAPWINKVEPEYWDRETQRCKGHETEFKHTVRTERSRFNRTGGFVSVQVMYGCEQRDDGSTAGYNQFGYEGKDFMYLDMETGNYNPIAHQAHFIALRWNSPEERQGERDKYYLENICIEWLKKFIIYGRDDLQRRVRPEVKVTGRRSGEVTKLQCQVYGFHPRAVDVKWMKNEQDEVQLDEAKQILPNPDGTYQTRVTVEVSAGEEERYSCHVDLSSLEGTLSVKWEPKSGLSLGVIIGVVIGCLVVLIAVIAGVLIYKKKKSDYKTTSYPEFTKMRNTEASAAIDRFPPFTLLVLCLLLLILLMLYNIQGTCYIQ
ncbi:putative HLA class I histocompatibility antigen, alpha chain H [Mixophyes fleayi]|uniref:putative HLA class I histocompatibility antigen, alpha chain H n=1 Tax=Mixophyes fleayi TaxID=3061075 RepID=UPI003F4DCC5F